MNMINLQEDNMAKSYIPKFIKDYMIVPKIIKDKNNVIVDSFENIAKPTGCNGLIKNVIKATAPQSHEEFTHSTLATRTPHTLEFPNEFRGKRVWVRACWQNSRGILGRWSEAKSAIIP